MDQQDIQNDNADSVWPEISADVTLARGAARSITLDTQRASTDGRIIELTGQLEHMRDRLSSLEEHIFDVESSAGSDEFAQQFAALNEEIAGTSVQFQALATRVAAAEESVATTMMVSVDGFDSRLALVEDARLSQSNELNQLTSYLEQAFTRIAELAEVIEDERTSNTQARATFADESAALTTSIDARVGELHDAIGQLNNQLHAATSSIDASSGDIHDALAASVDQLERRVAATESQVGAIDEISSSIQFLNARADALETQQQQTTDGHDAQSALADNVEQTQIRLDELSSTVASAVDAQDVNRVAMSRNREDINAHGTAIERAEASNVETRQLVQDVSDRIGNVAENADLIGHRVDLVQGTSEDLQERVEELRSTSTSLTSHVEHIDGTVHDLGGRLDNAATALDAAHSRLDDVAATTQSAHERIDHTAADLNARIEESAQAVNERLYETNQELDTRFGQTVDHMNGRLDETVNHVNQRLDETVNHVNQRLEESLDHRVEESVNTISQRVEGNVEEVGQRLASIDDELGNVDGRIQNIETESAAAAERSSEMAAKLDQTIECVEGAVGATADIARRVASTEEHAASTDVQITTVEDRVASIEHHAGEIDTRVDGVQTHVTEIDAKIDNKIDDVQVHVSTIENQVNAAEEQVATSTEHLASLDGRTSALETHTGETQQALGDLEQRVAEAEHLVSASDERFEVTEQHLASTDDRFNAAEQKLNDHDDRFEHVEDRVSQTHAHIEERSTALRDHLLSRVDEARAQLQLALDESNAQTSESQADLRTSVFDRLDVVEETIEARVAGLEHSILDVDHEPRLQSLETSVAAVENRADEAYAFTESLRQLQTDIVQALQEELRSQETQLGGFNSRIGQLESTGAEHASAERVHMLEAKLVEALQTISQLTQLQRRNTTVEAQLTDTLATTSHGVESTQTSVMQLREELEAAQQRIGHLEQRLSAQSGNVRPATVAPTQPLGLDDLRPIGFDDATSASVVPDEEADTGWFTESYARKNQEPKAS